LCTEALAGRSDAELTFLVMNLHVQLELALADAALGDLPAARGRCDGLLTRHSTTAGPLALGAMHETRARIALIERDFEGCRSQLDAMRRCYVPTQIASLLELTELLTQRLAQAERGDPAVAPGAAALLGDDAHVLTRMRLILANTEGTFEERAQRSLQLALELTGAHHGFVIALDHPAQTTHASHGPPPAGLLEWVQAQLRAADVEQTALADPGEPAGDDFVLLDGARYCAAVLHDPGAAVSPDSAGPAALVLGFIEGQPRTLRSDLLRTIARHLFESPSGQFRTDPAQL
jgi:hypothetical protein